jgi:AbrB family looped-hinge helix DNA binding protein
VTIPAHIRKYLGVKPGDRVEFHVRAGQVEIAAAQSVVERTKGIFKTNLPRLTPEEERAAFEQAVADEVVESMNRGR